MRLVSFRPALKEVEMSPETVRYPHAPEGSQLRAFVDEQVLVTGDDLADLLSFARTALDELVEAGLDHGLERMDHLVAAEFAYNEDDDVYGARESLQDAFRKYFT